jgi:NitT/TauT family transport system substrate-binding protein
MTPTRRLASLLAVAALAFAPAACGTAPGSSSTAAGATAAKTKVTLTLNWVLYGEHAPFYYGLKQGIYAKQGIDLQIKPGSGSGNTIQQVAQKKTDYGWADTPALVKGISKGMQVKSLGVYLQKGPSSIESLESKHIKKPSDLEGKTVGGTPGDALYATFPAWLTANGVDKTKVKVVDLDPPAKIGALAEGKVDAIMGFFQDQAPTIEAKTGKKMSYLLYADFGFNLLGTGLVVHDETLSQKPDLVKKFVKATQDSWAAAAKDIPGAVDAMAGMTEQEPPKDVLTKQLTLTVTLLGLDTGQPGVNSDEKWTETIKLMSQYGGLDNAGPVNTYWDASYASKG